MNATKGTIIYVGGFEMPDRNAAAHRAMNNAKAFSELGYHVVFCGVDNSVNCTDIDKKIGVFDNFPVFLSSSYKDLIKGMIDFKHIKSVIERYTDTKYIIAYNMHAIPLSKLLRICKAKHIKLIADVTEWYENKPSVNPIKLVKCIDTFWVMRVLHKKVDGMIVISSYLKEYYKRFVENIIVVPPLVDLEDEKWKADGGKKINGVEFVYAGSPGKEKDRLDKIIACFHLVDTNHHFRFTVIGITKEQFLSYHSKCKDVLDELGERVVFCGRVSHEESIASLNRADFCIILRDRTRKNMAGFPTKFVECITSGIGMIANDFSDIKEYFPFDAQNVLLNECDESGLAEAVNTTLTQYVPNRERTRNNSTFYYRKWLDVIEGMFVKFKEGKREI